MKNQLLWEAIQSFQLDEKMAEYDFSIRLSHENRWSIRFTEVAIVEYKRFMYLAAISESMVSPSSIVDIVWHQHLIFTHSYDRLCEVIGHKVAHIPSTHNPEESDKFVKATQFTSKMYLAEFGEAPPSSHWPSLGEKPNYYGLGSIPGSIDTTTPFVWLSLSLIPLVAFAFFVRLIPNPHFLIGYGLLSILGYAILEWVTQWRLDDFARTVTKGSQLANISPFELAAIEKNNTKFGIHWTVDSLYRRKVLKVLDKKSLTVSDLSYQAQNHFEKTVLEAVRTGAGKPYADVVESLRAKPLFDRFRQFKERLEETITTHPQYRNTILARWWYLGLFIMVGGIRLYAGLSYEKPILYLASFMVAGIVLLVSANLIFSKQLFKKALPSILMPASQKPIENGGIDEHWRYISLGTDAYSAAIIPLLMTTLPTDAFGRPDKSGGCGGGGCGGDGGGGCGGGCGGCGGG